MLETPYFITENNSKIDDLYNIDEMYVKVYLSHSINKPDGAIPVIIDNYIVKAILEKYPEKEAFFKSISFNDTFDWDNEVNFSFSTLYKDIQKEFKNIDIFFMDYEKLDLKIRKYANDLLRTRCVCSDGKLLFHLVSNIRYFDLRKQGYIFETYCDKEVLMLNHEIQILKIHNGIIVDDFYLKDSYKRDK